MAYDAPIDGPDDLAAQLEQLFDHREDLPPSRGHREVPPAVLPPEPAPAAFTVALEDLVEVVRQVVREELAGRDEPPAPPPLDLDTLADALLARLPPPSAPIADESVATATDGDPGPVIVELRRELDLLHGQLEVAFFGVDRRLDQVQLAASATSLQAERHIMALRSLTTALHQIESIARGNVDANAADAIYEAQLAIESEVTNATDEGPAVTAAAPVEGGVSGLRATPRTQAP